MPRINDAINGEFRERLLLLQADGSQNSLPSIRLAIQASLKKLHPVILVCNSTPAVYFGLDGLGNSVVIDRSGCIPGYDDAWIDPSASLLDVIKGVPDGPLTVGIESIDTLAQDIGSLSKCYKLLGSILAMVSGRPTPSRLILSLSSESLLLPLLVHPSFSANLTHLILHSPLIVRHLAESFLTAPPHSLPRRGFGRSSVQLLLEEKANGSHSPLRARSVERTLEAWMMDKFGNVRGLAWEDLPSLCDLKQRESIPHAKAEDRLDPTSLLALPFNLSLTDAQALARAKVPLPYAHEGQPLPNIPDDGRIVYEPDSADDVDDDDPDEDLDL
ncbi:hypothetical protein BS47DRAFT_1487668 [Hydnum rufescens UP504]|uniref:Elongator complex protein 5 n=1 Tax=Hydnum rufescens UP504 TaxID=1448309 RepID=A0A9P6DTV3_9AGAM|nr:hypothetical protein BS47DRAFT_1487668 [Hydnum rufescens UP504]